MANIYEKDGKHCESNTGKKDSQAILMKNPAGLSLNLIKIILFYHYIFPLSVRDIFVGNGVTELIRR
jgi:hypothetical protein